eukprot:11147875-Lingulodinium_polyedra.AAC.1
MPGPTRVCAGRPVAPGGLRPGRACGAVGYPLQLQICRQPHEARTLVVPAIGLYFAPRYHGCGCAAW